MLGFHCAGERGWNPALTFSMWSLLVGTNEINTAPAQDSQTAATSSDPAPPRLKLNLATGGSRDRNHFFHRQPFPHLGMLFAKSPSYVCEEGRRSWPTCPRTTSAVARIAGHRYPQCAGNAASAERTPNEKIGGDVFVWCIVPVAAQRLQPRIPAAQNAGCREQFHRRVSDSLLHQLHIHHGLAIGD